MFSECINTLKSMTTDVKSKKSHVFNTRSDHRTRGVSECLSLWRTSMNLFAHLPLPTMRLGLFLFFQLSEVPSLLTSPLTAAILLSFIHRLEDMFVLTLSLPFSLLPTYLRVCWSPLPCIYFPPTPHTSPSFLMLRKVSCMPLSHVNSPSTPYPAYVWE